MEKYAPFIGIFCLFILKYMILLSLKYVWIILTSNTFLFIFRRNKCQVWSKLKKRIIDFRSRKPPRINNSTLCEAEMREYQDTYRGVWKAEFDNIMLWMNNKCVYQEDKDKLNAYKNSVEQLINSTYTVVVTDWLDDYKLPPKSSERNSWGNGTRSALNQI